MASSSKNKNKTATGMGSQGTRAIKMVHTEMCRVGTSREA